MRLLMYPALTEKRCSISSLGSPRYHRSMIFASIAGSIFLANIIEDNSIIGLINMKLKQDDTGSNRPTFTSKYCGQATRMPFASQISVIWLPNVITFVRSVILLSGKNSINRFLEPDYMR